MKSKYIYLQVLNVCLCVHSANNAPESKILELNHFGQT